MDALLPLFVGFVLTTVFGGLLGIIFQRRLWSHQHAVQLNDERRAAAIRIFEELSRLLDRRLYRHRRLYWALLEAEGDGHLPEDAKQRMVDYVDVVSEWNGAVNRNLALVQHYFGQALRDQFDYDVGAMFVQLGQLQEASWRLAQAPDERRPTSDNLREQEQLLQRLSNKTYAYNLSLLAAVELIGRAPLNTSRSAWRSPVEPGGF